jgi:glyoxylase-like metal-dependent hydrolase (beta-lactamase superfamily II)
MAPTFLGWPIREVSAYAFADLLIDTGPSSTASRLVEWCRGGLVRRVLLTHHHEDHIGGAAALQEELGLPILASAGAVPILAGILEHAQGRLRRKIQYWEDLAGQARTLREQGLPVEEIALRLLGREGLLTYVSLGDFSKRNLIRGLLAGPGPG